MAIITLTTDLGYQDAYVGALKGRILTRCPSVQVVDIGHYIRPFNIFQAAYVVRNAYPDFPKGTVHLVGVESTESDNGRVVAFQYDGHLFVAFDNGLPALVSRAQQDELVMVKVDEATEPEHQTFLVRDILAELACKLANGNPLGKVGQPLKALAEANVQEPVLVDDAIRGHVVYIDHYGNAITNITQELFNDLDEGRPFQVNFKRNEVISQISKRYGDVPEGEQLCIFNSAGFLEIANNRGDASRLLGLRLGDIVMVNFSV